MTLLPNPAIAGLPRYNAGMNIELARTLSGHDTIAALASNENPQGCSPAVTALISSASVDPSRYPDPSCTVLRDAIATATGVAPDNIVVGNGSEELIAAISRAFIGPGRRALTVAPSFGLHEIDPLASGGTVLKVAMTDAMEFDIAGLVAALAAKPAVFFLPMPSNPVGCSLTRAQLSELVEATSPETVFVIDEAYFEFRGEGAPDGVDLLSTADFNGIVLRTFSKAYGLAGLRVGYGLFSSPALADLVMLAKPPFDVNVVAQMAATAAIGDQEWMRAAVSTIVVERERVRAALTRLDLFVAPSEANFLFVRTQLPSEEAARYLLSQGIIVKPWKEEGYRSFLRISIGAPAENDRLIAALAAMVSDDENSLDGQRSVLPKAGSAA